VDTVDPDGVEVGFDRVGERVDRRRVPSSGGASPNPGRSTATARCPRSRAGRIGLQQRQARPRPWMSSSGSPVPAQWRITGAACPIAAAAMHQTAPRASVAIGRRG
jgi:hypothetical protein